MALLTPALSDGPRPPTRRPLHLAAAVVSSLLLGLAGVSPAPAQESNLETAVKANYLYKFAPFVDWPVGAWPGPGAPLSVCVLGEDPFGPVLDQAVRGQSLGGRPIAVRRLQGVQAAGGCQILFVGRLKGQGVSEALRAVAGQPVLTVTDQSRGVSGGMIQFVMRDGRVRFDIDADAAQAAHLTISSKLLGLAVSVRRGAR